MPFSEYKIKLAKKLYGRCLATSHSLASCTPQPIKTKVAIECETALPAKEQAAQPYLAHLHDRVAL